MGIAIVFWGSKLENLHQGVMSFAEYTSLKAWPGLVFAGGGRGLSRNGSGPTGWGYVLSAQTLIKIFGKNIWICWLGSWPVWVPRVQCEEDTRQAVPQVKLGWTPGGKGLAGDQASLFLSPVHSLLTSSSAHWSSPSPSTTLVKSPSLHLCYSLQTWQASFILNNNYECRTH